MKLFLAPLLVLLLCGHAGLANAASGREAITLKEYSKVKNEEWFKAYVSGAGRALGFANAVLKRRKERPLSCEPTDIPVYQQNFLDILDREVKFAEQTSTATPDTEVALLLLMGLQSTFPCKP